MSRKTLAYLLVIAILTITLFIGCDSSKPAGPSGGNGNGSTAQNPRDITIQNSTGVSIIYCFVRKPGTDSWVNLFTATVENGDSRFATIPVVAMNGQYQTDIQLRNINGLLYTKLSQTITQNGTITFTTNDFEATGARIININNNTGDSVQYGYIRLPGSTSWTYLFSTAIDNGGSQSVIVQTTVMDSQYRADLQVRTATSVMYTKLAQNIIHNSTITFTVNDFDLTNPNRTITIQNNTGVEIQYGYAKLPGSQAWTVFLYTAVASGSSYSASIPISVMDSSNRSDLQLRTVNGVLFTKISQTITHNGTITFTSSDFDATGSRIVTIQNNTGVTIEYGGVVQPGTSNVSIIFMETLPSGSSVQATIPPQMLDNQNRTDIKLHSINATWYSKNLYTIINNSTITFTPSDLGW